MSAKTPLPNPCGRCRREAEVKPMDDGVWIGCSNGDCPEYAEAMFFPTRAEAIRRWNALTPPRAAGDGR